LVTITNYY